MKSYYDSPFWQLREIQRMLDALKPQLDSIHSLPLEVLAQFDQFRKIEEQFTFPPDYLEAVTKVNDQMSASFSALQYPVLGASHSEFVEAVSRQLGAFEGFATRIGDLGLQVEAISNSFAGSLAPIEALLETQRFAVEQITGAIVPHTAFQDLASSQLKLAELAESAVVRENRLDFVAEVASLLQHSVGGFEIGALLQDTPPEEAESEDQQYSEEALLRDHNLFVRLREKAKRIEFEDADLDVESVVHESCEARLVELGHSLVRLVRDLNVEAEREQRQEPFKPTTKTLFACGSITVVVASDDVSFSTVVDQLYFLLYEGSSSAKRLIDTYGKSALGPLWQLKQLRLSARHDVDHGSEREVAKKNEKIADAFRELAGTTVIKRPDDWCRAQLRLYESLVKMLEEMWFGVMDGTSETDGSEPSSGAVG